MFENITGGTNENTESVFETNELMQRLEQLNNDQAAMTLIEEALAEVGSDFKTLNEVLDTADVTAVESFTDGEIETIEEAFRVLTMNKDLESAVIAVQTLLGALEAANEGL